MNSQQSKLARRYLKTFGKYLADEREAGLQQAYEVGRMAVSRGVGVLDMARVHQEALENVLQPLPMLKDQDHVLKAAETFFLETLSPFEVTHRGFRETNARLQQLIETLEGRNLELARINHRLGLEIGERKRTEKALRESERHFRELFIEARRMEQNLRNLSNQILHVQEEERKRISRELHDEVGQAMTAISINIGVLRQNGTGSGEPFRQKIADTQALLQQTMETVHRFARELRPSLLDELGLLPALRSHLKSFTNRTGLSFSFRGNPIAEKLGADQKIVLFRVAQESLTNVAKHARASRVEVVICKLKDRICMEIADNGRSFKKDPADSAKSKKRLGLLGMQERLRLVNGRFMIRPEPGKGTIVRVEIPFNSGETAIFLKEERGGTGDKKAFSRRTQGNLIQKTKTAPRSHYGKNKSVAG